MKRRRGSVSQKQLMLADHSIDSFGGVSGFWREGLDWMGLRGHCFLVACTFQLRRLTPAKQEGG